MTTPDSKSAPIPPLPYERLMTPGHVLAARVRLALPTIAGLSLAAIIGSSAVLIVSGALAVGSVTPPARPASEKSEMISQISNAFALGSFALNETQIASVTDINETKDAFEYVKSAFATRDFKFDPELMVRISGTDFLNGRWQPGKIVVANAGNVVGIGMFVRNGEGRFARVSRWTIVARLIDGKWQIAELGGYANAFAIDPVRARTLQSLPSTLVTILNSKI
jgi:hypothetical protein